MPALIPPKPVTAKKTTVTNTSATSKSGQSRLSKLANSKQANWLLNTTGGALKGVGIVGSLGTNASLLYLAGSALQKTAKTSATKPDPKATTGETGSQNTTGAGVRYNLPPHQWSLPVRAAHVVGDVVGAGSVDNDVHKLRRGRIWPFANNDKVSLSDDKGKPINLGNPIPYGFQFIWNPTEINFSMQRNQDVTPSSADTLKVVSGAFPSQENISFNFVLDRTNDFACAKAAVSTRATWFVGPLQQFQDYYKEGYSFGATDVPFIKKMEELLKTGTNHDLEYLFRAVNGGNTDKSVYKNKLGRITADIGYLIPNLMAIQFGRPNSDSMSYIGWVDSIQWSHTAFTEDMIPLRTNVQVSFMTFVGSTLTSVSTDSSGKPKK